MNCPSTIVQRLLTAAAMVVAFVFMASIFSPDTTRAGQVSARGSRSEVSPWTPRTKAADSSVDPHEGLASLGQIEGLDHIVRIYSTPLGPRYTVVQCDNDEILATLMTAEDVERFFPEISIRDIHFDTAEPQHNGDSIGPLMLAEPDGPDQW